LINIVQMVCSAMIPDFQPTDRASIRIYPDLDFGILTKICAPAELLLIVDALPIPIAILFIHHISD